MPDEKSIKIQIFGSFALNKSFQQECFGRYIST